MTKILAIVAAFKQWQHYLDGSAHTIEVLIDHNNLVAFQNLKALNGRQSHWAIVLSGYDFVIAHQPGKGNPADAPSRRPDYMPSIEEINRQASLLLPTFQKKLALMQPAEQSRSWLAAKEQEISTLHAYVAEPREQEKPSALTARFYGDSTELPEPQTEETDSSESEGDSDAETSMQEEQDQRDETSWALLLMQHLPQGLVKICRVGIDNVYGEENLKDKPLQDLIAKLQLEDPFMRKKLATTKVQVSCKKDQELKGSKWHFQDN